MRISVSKQNAKYISLRSELFVPKTVKCDSQQCYSIVHRQVNVYYGLLRANPASWS